MTKVVEWCTPPPGLSLSADAVHVWRANLGLEVGRLRALEQNLSADERTRASRFRFAQDRKRFIAARGLLRKIVAFYLNMAAQELHFEYGAHGKPFLAEPEYSSLRFNVSHSLDVALIAVAYEREVGVDIEHVHTDIAVKEIAKTVLSGPEKHALSRFVDESKRTACLQLWTRKEAYVKADGRGMSLPLKHVDVSVPADRVAVLNNATGKSKVSMRWMLETLAVGPDYVAALAAEGQDWQLTCWQWEDNERAI